MFVFQSDRVSVPVCSPPFKMDNAERSSWPRRFSYWASWASPAIYCHAVSGEYGGLSVLETLILMSVILILDKW